MDGGPDRQGTGANAGLLPRPRLRARLDDLVGRRLGILVAGAGYGKTTLVDAWLEDRPAAWVRLDPGAVSLQVLAGRTIRALRRAVPDLPAELVASGERATSLEADPVAADATADDGRLLADRADAVSASIAEALEAHLADDLFLVLDDLHELGDAPAAMRFVEGLVRGTPPAVHLIVTSRRPVPFPIERLRGQGQVVEIGADLLRFDADEVAALLDRLEPPAEALADDLMRRTDGWPALVRLVVESLRDVAPADRAAAIDRMDEPGGRLVAYITEEVLDREPPETQAVLRLAGQFERLDPELLGGLGIPDAGGAIEDLHRRAFLIEEHRDGPGRTFALHRLVRDPIRQRLPIEAVDLRTVRDRAATWLADHGRVAEAIEQRLLLEDAPGIAALIETHGEALLADGSLTAIVDGVRAVPPPARSTGLETMLGDALVRRGQWDEALAAFHRAIARHPDAGGAIPAALAWRIGLLQFERGDPVVAMATYERADLERGEPADHALVGAWRSIAHWMRLEADDARPWAAIAMEAAQRSSDDRAMAAALAATGAVASLDGDTVRSVDLFRQAAVNAERAGDTLIGSRFRADLGYLLTLGGQYADALIALDTAVRMATAVGHSTILALSLTDRGLAHLGLGHLEEAAADLHAARELYDRMGSRWATYPMMRLANLHRIRGEMAAARRIYTEAAPIARALGPAWFYPEILNGLALTVVEDDPARALGLAAEATGFLVETEPAAAANLNAGRVALLAGDPDLARRYAARAIALAEARWDRPSGAGALELSAQLTDDPAEARRLLDEASAIWEETGSPFGRHRHEVIRARVLGGPAGVDAARSAAQGFRAMGAWSLADDADSVADQLAASTRPAVEIQALGTFRVIRSGMPVALGEWQSRKARDILKILVARRGRSISREQLCELLWPDEDPGPLLNRLSVALAVVRSVLDPDRAQPPDHFITGDKLAVALDLDRVRVDVEAFLEAASHARRSALQEPTEAQARAMAVAEAEYGGDFLAEDPDAPWADDLREEARVAYLEIARALAGRAAREGDTDGAVRRYLRILDPDPYDEDAHLGLVRSLAAAGRHGEARRRYGIYVARMAELGIEPVAYPSRDAGARPLVA